MVKRELNISKLLGKSNSILMLGARGVGKTHLVKQFLASYDGHILEVDLLQFATFQKYLTDPGKLRREIDKLLRTEKHLLVFIDEIQKVPVLLDEIHSAIENYKGHLQFILTGSSARKLKRSGANLLAGRAIGARLHPLTCREVPIDLERILRIGTLPIVFFENDVPEQILKTYVEVYLQTEIMQEALVRKIEAFARFLDLAGQFHTEIINAAEIAKYAGVSVPTILEYFQILEDTLLGFRLPGWSASPKKQLRINPKFYFFDNGVANLIRGEINVQLLPRTSRWGHLFEAWLIQEIYRLNDYYLLGLRLSYWRTNNDMEVDLVISRGLGQPLAAIEIKSDSAPSEKKYRGLLAFSSDYPKVPLYCFATNDHAYSEGKVEILPWQEGLEFIRTL